MTFNEIDVVGLTQKFIQAPSFSGDEKAAAEVAKHAMEALGFHQVERDSMGSITGVVGPENGQPALLFDGHIDVVPIAGEWKFDPFGGEIHNGRIYGRGTTDMKGPVAAAICGIAQAARKGKLKRPVVMSASVMEEVTEGVALARIMDRYQPEAVVICEASALELRIGQKGRLEIVLEIHGQPAHASMPQEGNNPIDLAARAILSLETIDSVYDPLLGKGVLVAVSIISNPFPSPSMIPSKTVINFDRRTVPTETRETVFSQISNALKSHDITEFSLSCQSDTVETYTGEKINPERDFPPWIIDENHPLCQAGLRAIEAAGVPRKTGGWVFCTNGSESAGRRNIPTIGIGPGDVRHAHIADEYIEIEQLTKAVEIYKNLVLECAG